MAYNYLPGLGSVGSFQVSGKPFATGAISPVDGVIQINFPAVTSWVMVRNIGDEPAYVGFSEAGVADDVGADNFFWELDASSGSLGPVDLKVTQLFLSGSRLDSESLSVLAGLTGIIPGQLDLVSGSATLMGGVGIVGPNWSGSAGVG